MKKHIFLLASLVVIFGINTGTVSALDRVAVTLNDNNLYVKEGAINNGWEKLTTGVNIGNYSLSGDRVVVLDQGSSNKTISIKEPLLGAPFTATYYGAPYAAKTLTGKLSNGQYRFLVLRDDGSVVMKDGPYNAGYWSGTVEPLGVSKIVIGGDRIGVIMNDGTFKVKELIPGKFSHPNNVGWSLVGDNVTEAVMTNNRIAILRAGAVWAKGGLVNAPWFGQVPGLYEPATIYDYATGVRMAGNRLCAIKVTGGGNDPYVECKELYLEEDFSNNPKLTYTLVADFKINPTRFLVLKADGKVEVMEGTLTNNSGWSLVTFNNATSIDLN